MKFEQYVNESINDKGIFKAVFMAGSPGAGKSFVRRKLGGSIDPRVVNTDKWTEYFDDDWKGYSEKIKTITENELSLYINSMLPLWVDGTSSNPTNLMSREGLLSGIGYDTGMIWVNTNLETAIQRAEEREGRGGRHVGVDWLTKTFNHIQKLKPFYKSRFSWFHEVDNNDGMLTDDVVMKLYKQTSSFFTKPVINPVGQGRINKLRKEGGKYLIDLPSYDEDQLKRLTRSWFDK